MRECVPAIMQVEYNKLRQQYGLDEDTTWLLLRNNAMRHYYYAVVKVLLPHVR